MDRAANGDAAPKPVSAYHVVGTSVARLDLPDKLSGRPRYVHDLTLDGMLYGRVVRPPSRAATLLDIDTGPTRDLPGVVAVVRDGDFIAVVAEHEEVALRAADLLRRDAIWEQRPTLPDEDDLPAFLTSAPTDTTVVADVGQRPRSDVVRSVTASYHRPYLAHGSIGPSCAVALAAHDRLRDLDTQPGSAHVAPRDRAVARAFTGPSRGPARRRRRLLWPQRRRRRGDGRRGARPRRTGPTGAGGVVAPRRVELVSPRTRWRGADLGGLRPRRHRVVVAPRDLERQLHQPPRHDTDPRIPGSQPPRGRRGDPLGG